MRREVPEKRQRILCDEHPDTVPAANNLAITLGDQGKVDRAVAMVREVLEKRRRNPIQVMLEVKDWRHGLETCQYMLKVWKWVL